jgi:hypothetical protein
VRDREEPEVGEPHGTAGPPRLGLQARREWRGERADRRLVPLGGLPEREQEERHGEETEHGASSG